MHSPLRLPLALTVVALTFALPLTAQAATSQNYPAMLSVNGGLTVTSQHGTLKSCQPAQEYTLSENADIAVRGRVKIDRVGGKLISSTTAKKKGGAISRNELTSYEESNYCPPDDDPIELVRPECRTLTGTGVAALVVDPRKANSGRVSIGMKRATGGDQSIGCMSLGVSNPTPAGSLINRFENKYSDIVLPLDLKISQFRKLGKGKKFIRTIRIGGSCDGAIVYRGSKVSKFAAEENSCEVEGVFNVEIKRLK